MCFSTVKWILFQNTWSDTGFSTWWKCHSRQGFYLTYLTLCPQHLVWHGSSLVFRCITWMDSPVWSPAWVCGGPRQVQSEVQVRERSESTPVEGRDWLRTQQPACHMSLPAWYEVQLGPWLFVIFPHVSVRFRETLSCSDAEGGRCDVCPHWCCSPTPHLSKCFCSVWHAASAQPRLRFAS